MTLKKILGILLITVMAMTCMTVAAFAKEGNIASGTDGCAWVIDGDGVLTIYEGTLIVDYSKYIQSPWESYCNEIKSVKTNGKVAFKDGYMLFRDCENLVSVDLSGVDTSSVNSMEGLFWNCRSLNSINLTGWNTSNVTSMRGMFEGCQSLSSMDLSGFNTASVTDMGDLFCNCYALASVDITGWNTSNVTDMSWMFAHCGNLTSVDVSGFNTANVIDMSSMFSECYKLTSIAVNNFDTSKTENMGHMFNWCNNLSELDVSRWDTRKVTNMAYMFSCCEKLSGLDVTGFNTSNVTDMRGMFDGCRNLTSLNVSGFDTSKVTNMEDMFLNCNELTSLDISGFNTSNVTNMHGMFWDCRNVDGLNTANFNTSKVTDMGYMFYGCSSLTSLDVSGFDTSSVTNMREMFGNSSQITSLDLKSFNTSNVTSMEGMFCGCGALTSLNLTSFDTSKVTNMKHMFYYCFDLAYLDLSSFNIRNVTEDMSEFLKGCDELETLKVGEGWKYNTSVSISYPPVFPCKMENIITGKICYSTIPQGAATYVTTDKDPSEEDIIYEKLTLDDVWSFHNPTDKISLNKYIDLFGLLMGSTFWSGYDGGDSGKCFGMCESVLAITHKNSPSLNSLGLSSLRDVTLQQAKNKDIPDMNMTLNDYIDYAHVFQYSNAWQTFVMSSIGNYDTLCRRLEEYFNGYGEPLVLHLRMKNTGNVHALLPLSMQKIENVIRIGIYDCNDPDHEYYITFTEADDHITGFSGEINGMSISDSGFEIGYSCLTNDFISNLYIHKYEPPGVYLLKTTVPVAKMIEEIDGFLHYFVRSDGAINDGQNGNTLLWAETFGQPVSLAEVPSGESVQFVSDKKSIEIIPGKDASVVLTPESSENASVLINEDSSAANTVKILSGIEIDSMTMTTVSIHGQSVTADIKGSDVEIKGADQIEMKQTEGELTESGKIEGETTNAIDTTNLDSSQVYYVDIQNGSIVSEDGTIPEPTPASEPEPEPNHQHTYGNWKTIKDATELAAGKKIRKCSGCGKIETAIIPQHKPSLKVVTILKPKAEKKAITIKWKKITKKNLKNIKKVQIQYSTDKNFKKGVKNKYVKAKNTSYKLRKLKKGKKYYVRIRAYTKSGGKVHISKWSKKKSFKVK